MVATNVRKWVAYGAGFAIAAAGAFTAGRAAGSEPQKHAQPETSAPGLTSADIVGVRTELRAIQGESNRRFELLDQRLSHLEGYVAGAGARR